MDETKKTFPPTPPYDESLEGDYSMYDHMPYQIDPSLCNRDTVAMYSGNVIKYYRCHNSGTYSLDNQDTVMEEKLKKYRQESIHRELLQEELSEDLTTNPEASDIEKLLQDSSAADAAESAAEP